jgi:hypothetical protein
MKKGRAGTMTHDYKRHGTTTLFAALSLRCDNCWEPHRLLSFTPFQISSGECRITLSSLNAA